MFFFWFLCLQPRIHLVESHGCWCNNSQEIAELISHLLPKDFPRMKYFSSAHTSRQRFFLNYFFFFQFLLSLAVVCLLVSGDPRWGEENFSQHWKYFIFSSRQTRQRQDEDESIQGFVFERAKRLGYGLRIIPRVREILFGRTASKPASKKKVVREKRKLREQRRPIRPPSQAGGAKLKSSPRNLHHLKLQTWNLTPLWLSE